MNVSRKQQSEMVRAGTASLRVWAEENGIPLVAAHEMTRSIIDKNDLGVGVWLFFDTDANVTQFNSDGTSARVQDAFSKILRDGGYPVEWLKYVTFHVDSHECVERDFEGSYFYYFR